MIRVLSLIFTLTLCFAANATKKALPPIKVGASPVVSSSGIFLAKENGHFKKLGLNVDITPFRRSGAPMTLLLARGELDVGGGNLSSGLWNAIAKGQQIKLVADKGHVSKGASYISLIVRADHIKSGRFKTLKDLKGFKMALTALGGVSQQIAAEKFLRKAGLTLKDVSFQKMSYGEMNIALKKKIIDATVQLEPYVAKANVDGVAKTVATVFDVYPNQQSAAIFFSPKFVKERPEDAKKFLQAYLMGVRDYEKAFLEGKGKADAITKLKKHVKVKSDKVWLNMTPIGLNPNGYINTSTLMDDLKWYHKHGFVDKVPNLEAIVDHSFVEAALGKLGKYKRK